jgi:hypothetical protein
VSPVYFRAGWWVLTLYSLDREWAMCLLWPLGRHQPLGDGLGGE